jgi:hypothetical protein
MAFRLFTGPDNDDVIPAQGIQRAKALLAEELGSSSFGIVRLLKLGITGLLFFFPTIYIDTIFKSSKASVVACYREMYYIMRAAFLATVLWGGFYQPVFIIVIIIYLLAEILLHLIGGALVWGRYSINPQRSLVLTFINYAEFTIAFAVFYLHWDCLSLHPLSTTQALYFSLVTATTVGYGDITPGNSTAQVIVMIQLSVFVLFVLLFLTTFVSRIPNELRK